MMPAPKKRTTEAELGGVALGNSRLQQGAVVRIDWFARAAAEAQKALAAEMDRAPAITVRRDYVFADMPAAERRRLLLLCENTGLPLKIVTLRTIVETTQ